MNKSKSSKYFIQLTEWLNTALQYKEKKTCHHTQTHYSDSKPTSFCSNSLMLCAGGRSSKYQFSITLRIRKAILVKIKLDIHFITKNILINLNVIFLKFYLVTSKFNKNFWNNSIIVLHNFITLFQFICHSVTWKTNVS